MIFNLRFRRSLTKTNFTIYILVAAALMTACYDRSQTAAVPSPTAAASSPSPASSTAPSTGTNQIDKWLGKWNGPEGTYLHISRRGDRYTVRIGSLDGQGTYEGVAAGNGIEFVRDGKTESIRAGTGEETGMKWLLDEKNCLIIKKGEGFCRRAVPSNTRGAGAVDSSSGLAIQIVLSIRLVSTKRADARENLPRQITIVT